MTSEEIPSIENRSEPRWFPWRTAMFLATLLALCGFALFAYFRTLEQAAAVAGRFKTGRITQTFLEQIPEVISTHGDVLEVATAESREIFTQSDSLSVLGETISLGTTVSEIRVPVTYRYHIRLSDRWKLSTHGTVCSVIAPSLRPSLPPAIHTDRMEKQTAAGWLRFNAQQNLDALERSITPRLNQRASNSEHVALVRETARKSVGEFVKNWLIREDQWRGQRFDAIVVVFEDELSGNAATLKERVPTVAR